jgi:hypothetical protein
MTAYSWKRAGRTLEERGLFRRAVIEASRKDVASAVEQCLLPQKGVVVSFLGEAMFRKEKIPLEVFST